jgi:coenzyme F420-dependent glucose-6-phosphate dehydrogenase
MVTLGYAMSSEEHKPRDLVRHAQLAEQTGFTFALISDHYHPWTNRQGNSPFVWSVLGAIAMNTTRLQMGTGVTCPLIRIHPAIIAQAAATISVMMEGRFFLGVGSGEKLNEHILGDRWPAYEMRAEMLEEAIKVLRLLWEGGSKTYYGKHYTVENAQIYTLPEKPTPIMIAAAGPVAARLAGRLGDGLISTAPEAEVVSEYENAGGKGCPKYGQLTVCWAASEAEAKKTAFEWWPTAALHGELGQELPTPAHFEQAAQGVKEEDVAEMVICGPDAQRHIEAIQEFVKAGFDHVYVHQVGPDQEGFMQFYKQKVMPALS